MERPGDTAIQGIIGVAEDNPDWALELPQPGDLFCVCDLIMGNRSSFRRKKAGRALGVASNC